MRVHGTKKKIGDNMRDENTLMVSGRLTKDPEYQDRGDGKGTTKFSIAIHVDENKTYFTRVTAYDNIAKYIAEAFHKGDPVMIRGYIRQNSWVDETSGKKQSMIDVVAQRISKLTFPERNANLT